MVRHKMNDLDIYIMKMENTWNMISFTLARQILFYGNTLVTYNVSRYLENSIPSI